MPQVQPQAKGTGALAGLPDLRTGGGNKASAIQEMKLASMDILAMEANLDEEEKLYDRKMPGEGPGFDEPTKVGGLFSQKAAAIPDKPKEEVKQDNVESLEDRKKRLQAQKQAMIQKRKEQMEQKLQESRKQETDNAYSNHVLKDFLELDK